MLERNPYFHIKPLSDYLGTCSDKYAEFDGASMTLVSFVGVTDMRLAEQARGPILTAVRELRPTRVLLLVTEGDLQHDFSKGARAVRVAIKSFDSSIVVSTSSIEIDDPTDHNEIYPKLRDEVASRFKASDDVVAAISSGTPSMQVCWILLAESGDAPIRLIRTIEPELTTIVVRDVRLDTGLPRITRLEQENRELRDIAIEPVTLHRKRGHVMIGNTKVNLSPLMFGYYRFFLELARKAKAIEDAGFRMSMFTMGETNTKLINEYQAEAFPDYENSDLVRLAKTRADIPAQDFRSTISKLNKRLTDELGNKTLASFYHVQADGPKSARHYSIRLEPSKIHFK
jgi:hypothetical protein